METSFVQCHLAMLPACHSSQSDPWQAYNRCAQGGTGAQVTLIVRHLYQRCLENSKVAHSSQADLCSQLKVIGSYISDLASILQEHDVKTGPDP